MNFAESLKSERKRLKLTRAGASALLRDVSESWIAKSETGAREPHPWMQAEALRRLREIKKASTCRAAPNS
jgi:predicted transcriptional regulator